MLVNKASFCSTEVTWLWKVSGWDENVGEEGGAEVDAFWRGRGDTPVYDFVAEGTENDEPEFDIDVYEAGAVADESF